MKVKWMKHERSYGAGDRKQSSRLSGAGDRGVCNDELRVQRGHLVGGCGAGGVLI
jgi:hypothetical protein